MEDKNNSLGCLIPVILFALGTLTSIVFKAAEGIIARLDTIISLLK